MKLYNTFTGGAMNKDIEVRLLPKNFYLDAKNIRITTPDGQNSRSVKFALGNTQQSALSLGTNAKCVGSCVDTFRNKIYWAVASDSGSYINEYDVATATENIVLSDTRSGASNLFGFSTTDYVEMRVINDNDNGKNFIVITSENSDEPKFFEIEAGKALVDSSFTLEDISLIKAPPRTAPSLTLGATVSGAENNLESKFLSFAYRYKYQNGEYSALSQFSDFAFLPDSFAYNYKAGTNSSMFNDFSKVDIQVETGSNNVSDVQLIVKESRSNTAFIVNTYNKVKESWGDNTSQTVTFDNSRIYKALDANQLSRIYDNVPINAATLEVIGNRIVFGNYTEGYDLTYQGSPINLSLSLGYTGVTGSTGTPHKTVKTNRDYEIAIAYGDGKGRITTPLTSADNTTYIPYSEASKKNTLRIIIDKNSRPPDWATTYRFFIKQSKTDYDVIAPIIFYRDGVYAWVKLEGNDTQKVGEGDFLYVKSDTSGLKPSTVRTKVLEVSVKDRNFLETDDVIINGDSTLQEGGVYMRLQVEGYALSAEAVTTYEWIGYSYRTASTPNNILAQVNYIENIYYTGNDLDDLSATGSLTGIHDIRFEIEIDGTAPDTFRWRKWETSVSPNTGYGAYTSGLTITGGSQPLSDGISISFTQTTGHTVGDRWYVSAKSDNRVDLWDGGGDVTSDGRRAIVLLQSKDATDGDESIRAGAVINITYNDSPSSEGVSNLIGFQQLSLTSSKDYPNIEEWFYGDSIIDSMSPVVGSVEDVLFRRGTLSKTNGEQMTVTGSTLDRMYMAFLSACNYTGGGTIRIDNSLTITEFDNNVIFETIPTDITTDTFYELPYTYNISNGVHLGNTGDIGQAFGILDATINLPYFNCFGWYNGFESYKIGDTFNENTMVLDTKPLTPIEEYKSIKRIASLTYSDTYESTTQYNNLNEFNLAEVNYKDMDIKYGAIRKLHSRDTDLTVFQHDKTHRILFSKSVLFNADGTGNVSQSFNVLGQEVAYTGEYGICNNPESFAFFGNRIYHLDKDRGALMRLSTDGYTEISENGLKDYFRTLTSKTRYVGGYDPYNDEYLINTEADPLTLSFQEGVGFQTFFEYEPERLVGINNRLYSIKEGQIWLHDDNATRNNFYGVQTTASISTVFNDSPQDVKHWKSVNLESNIPWETTITTNFATGSITSAEYSLEEGEYYAYIRQNETAGIATEGEDSSIGGIGEISVISVNTLTINVGELPRALAIGDTIYKDNGNDTVTTIGTVVSYDRTLSTITLDTVTGLLVSDFILFGKSVRVEGEAIKGYFSRIDLTSNDSGDNKLFAVKVEAVRSFD